MTTDTLSNASPTTQRLELGPVALDLYRDIHKAIRVELCSVTNDAGRLDPADRTGRGALAAHVRSTVGFLVDHAEHEDTHVQPAIEAHLPDLAEIIEGDHARLEDRMVTLVEMADGLVDAETARQPLHRLYLELASFTATYLEHQDIEERVVMPALEVAIGVPAVVGIHEAIVGSIPPEEMTQSLALMLPAMNIEDRAEMLGGMQANAPAEVFSGVWSLAGSVLPPSDIVALGARLGVN